jgi:molybdate transport repressor ModE-like protein
MTFVPGAARAHNPTDEAAAHLRVRLPMSKLTIRASWRFEIDGGGEVDPRLFVLLRAIRDSGSLKLAVQEVQMSYRHGWDMLKHAAGAFGSPLVRLERGRGAQLTVLGEKLLWAEQRCDSSLFPQLDNVASELNLEIRRARSGTQAVLRLHASHGYAVEKLPQLMARHGHATMDLQYMGSVDALASLSRHHCDLAGFHVPLGSIGRGLWGQYARWLKPRQHRIIRLVLRTQGLIVAPGNPRSIHSIADLARADVRFVNRQRGSGTRILLDGLLREAGIEPTGIQGYGTGEFTHAAVAAFVSSGMVDVAFGVEPAARQFKLDFVSIARERYMLACRVESLDEEPVRELIGLLRDDALRGILGPVPGYEPDEPGAVVDVRDIVP